MPHFENRSFWIHDYGHCDISPALSGDTCVDVAIIGGGYCGLSTAYHLKQADPALTVALLESEIVGFGASGRNGGWLVSQFGLEPLILQKMFGKTKAAEARTYALESFNYACELIEELEFDCDFRRSGALRLAIGEKGLKRLHALRDDAQRQGLADSVSWLDADELKQELDCEMVDAALYDRNVAVAQPFKLARELKRAAQQVGAAVYENTPALSLDYSNDGVVAQTPRGTVAAKRIVLATNGYSHLQGGEIGRMIKRDQMPMIPVMHVTEPLPEEVWAKVVSRSHQCPMHTTFALYHGYTPTPDRRLVLWYFRDMQATTEPEMRPFEYDLENREVTRCHLQEIFPALRGVKIAQTWGGPISITADMVPHIGFVDEHERVLRSTGCGGAGVALSLQNGRTLSELLVGKDTTRTRFSFANRRGRQWPAAGLGFMSAKLMVRKMQSDHRTHIGATRLSDIGQ